MLYHCAGIIVLAMMMLGCHGFRLGGRGLRRLVSRGSGSGSISMMATTPERVRFAPSPTGSLHVGGARTALYNWLMARKTGGKFIVRVEDTDEARSTKESEKMILDDISWMNMDWDEGPEVNGPYGPYRQSERKDIYKEAADKLIAQGVAYPCFCTPEELDKKREEAEAAGVDPKYDGTWRDADPAEVKKRVDAGEPYTVRFKVPEGKVVSIDDMVRGTVTWNAEDCLGDFIILRSNGMPVYNFCVAVDDANMQITTVVRAEEHLSNTLRQMLVLEAMGYPAPTYAHCSLILGSDRSKLSKRHGAASVKQFSDLGFVPAAMMNYLANLGWNDGTDKEIYSPEELVKAFDLSRVVKSAAVFDMDKLRWVNSQHLKALPEEELVALVSSFLTSPPEGQGEALFDATTDASAVFVAQGVKLAKKDLEVVNDARPLIESCLTYDLKKLLESKDEEAVRIAGEPGFAEIVKRVVRDHKEGHLPSGKEEDFEATFKAYVKALGKELGLKGKALFHPARLALTGRTSGPDIGDQVKLLALAEGVVPAVSFTSLQERIEVLEAVCG